MRKLFSILISILLVVTTLTACGNKTIEDGKTETIKTFGKFKGNIVAGTVFSEGLALVCDGKNSYCINTKGEIVFKTEKRYIDVFGGIECKGFKNGLIYIEDGFYDIKGNYTTPEDVGATKFYDCILEEGYIFADVCEEDSSTIKRGVLDTNFKWIVEPSEEYYQNCDKVSINLDNNDGYFEKGYYFDYMGVGFHGAVEVLTGKTYNPGEFPDNNFSSSTWLGTNENTVIDFNNNIKIEIENMGDYNIDFGGYSFINEKIIANFYQKYNRFFSLIDTKGNCAFELIELVDGLDQIINTDKYIFAYRGVFSSENKENFLQVYDLSGNKILETEKMQARQYDIGDDIITMHHDYTVYNENIESNELRTEVKYYDMEFNQLFS